MKDNYQVYKNMQIIVISLTLITIFSILISNDYKNLSFLKYVNSVSAFASVLLLLITLINKIQEEKSIIVSDRKEYIRKFSKVVNVFVIGFVIGFAILIISQVPLNDKFNDILGIFSVGLALSTEFIGDIITGKLMKKSKRKYESRYNNLYN